MSRVSPRTLPSDPDLRRIFARLHASFPKDSQIAHKSGYSEYTIRHWRREDHRITLSAFRDLAATAGFQIALTKLPQKD